MALFTKRQFSELTGVTTNNLAVYIRRGQVLLKGGKCACAKNKCTCLIDDQQEKNRAFIEKMGGKAPATEAPAKEPLRAIRPPKNQEELDEVGSEEEEEEEQTSNDFPALQKQKLREQIKELQKKNKLHEAKIKKIYEDIIPRDHVTHLIVALSEGVKGGWTRASETLILQLASANQLTRDEQVYWRGKLTQVVNETVKDSVEQAKKSLRRIAREFSGKKERGERV